ncbi:Arginyl-tRNA synthetase [hydrothermal vent metagenome]|uniref:arginine--tRNA ligase n=1 Tax=hydrothermal vent metagenome TaxID=652676 RepID=A0A1W1EK49_9ZZZZ
MKLKQQISSVINNALLKSNIEVDNPIVINDATKVEFGDYQYNGVMGLAKKLKKNPREIAQEVVSNISLDGVISKAEVAGPGFINITLSDTFLSNEISAILDDSRLGISKTNNPQTIVVDYSGPNMAKEMHVGHLRSTIIGDALVKLFRFLGDNVIAQNHIGDWGTQFGMLIAYLEDIGVEQSDKLKDLEEFYKSAKKRFDEDEDFKNRAREYVVKIQQGDKHCLKLWKNFIDVSISHCQDVYSMLNVSLTNDDIKPESFYNDDLPKVIEDLDSKDMIKVSDGAKCVFLENREIPVIVQKGDGGYLYATTDLSALRYRNSRLKANRVVYVVDARQSQHFKDIFEVAKKSGFVDSDVLLEHIAFGTMMNRDGKPFKTRDGGTVKLINLLEESISKAKDAIKDRNQYTQDELEEVAKVVGIGAVKYADLSINRESNYIFNLDKMISFEGNTSLYMQYAYARIQSILRKSQQDIKVDKILISNSIEHRLVVMILKFEDTLNRASKDSTPHIISAYLYDLAGLFMKFYEANPILENDSRLAISKVTGETIKLGLDILGIEVLERI